MIQHPLIKIYVCISTILISEKINAQLLLPVGHGNGIQELSMTVGLEPELVTMISYRYRIGPKESGYTLGTSLKFDPLILNNKPYRVSLFCQAGFGLTNQMTLLVLPQIYFAHLADRSADLNGIGFDFQLSPSWKGSKWNKGILLDWQHTVFTHVRLRREAQQAFAQRYIFPHTEENKDGWYSTHSNRLRLGLIFSHAFTTKSSIQITAGSLYNFQKQKILIGFSHAQVPVFLEGMFRYIIND